MSYYEFHTAKRYIQHEGALGEFARYSGSIGKKFLVLLGSNTVKERAREEILGSIGRPVAESMQPALLKSSPKYAAYQDRAAFYDEQRTEMSCIFLDVRNQVLCRKTAQEAAAILQENGCDVVVGVGGGKGLDFARAVTQYAPAKVILVPTTAATNASISQSSVLYTEDGSRIESYWQMDTTPELVLADTGILLDTTPEILAAGIGDIMSTYYEALCNVALSQSGANHSLLSTAGIQLAIDLIRQHAPEALDAVRTKTSNQAFETILSLILHNCGPFRAISGAGFAHILDEVLLHFPQSHKVMHGQRVGFTTIPMLLHQKLPCQVIDAYISLCMDIGVPVTLSQMGLGEVPQESWLQVCNEVISHGSYIAGLPFRLTADELAASLPAAESYVAGYTERLRDAVQ